MKPIARFHRYDFGNAVAGRLRARGMSIRDFTGAHPWISVAAVSRAMNGKPLSTENILALSAELELDPFEYFVVEYQTVSAPVSRETSLDASRAAPAALRPVAPAGPRKGSDGRSASQSSLGGIGRILGRLREART